MVEISRKSIKKLEIEKPQARFTSSLGYIFNIDIPAEGNGPLLFMEALADNDMLIMAAKSMVKIDFNNVPYFRYAGHINKSDAEKVVKYINDNLPT